MFPLKFLKERVLTQNHQKKLEGNLFKLLYGVEMEVVLHIVIAYSTWSKEEGFEILVSSLNNVQFRIADPHS